MNIPDKCFSLLNTTIHLDDGIGTLIIIKALETGYYPQEYRCTQDEVDERNTELGVTKAQAKAMETASIFGWHAYEPTLKLYEKKFDSESDEPNGQDPDGTTDLALEPLEEEWNDETDWCTYCQMDVEGDEAGNCPHCGNLITLIEETDYLEEDDNGFNQGGEEWDE